MASKRRDALKPATWVLVAAVCMLASLPGLAVAEEDKLDGRVSVSLAGALQFKTLRTSRRTPWKPVGDLTLDLVCRDGTWDRTAWGFTTYIPGQEHLGRITDARSTGDRSWSLTIEMDINPSRHRPCTLGGPVTIDLSLEATGEGLAGTYELTSRDTHDAETMARLERRWGMGRSPGRKDWQQPTLANRLQAFLKSATTRGKARGNVRPHVRKIEGVERFADGEHPRLLFRPEHLDELRRRAKTPRGREIIAELKSMLQRAEKYGYGFRYPQAEHTMGPMWAAGWGLLYQMTGEKDYALKAGEQFRGPMYGSYYYGGWWIHPYALMGMAVSYDLCKDAWPARRREIVYAFLERNIRDLAHRHDLDDLLGTGERYHFANDQTEFAVDSPTDARAAKFRAAAAIAALALLGDTPPIYQPPELQEVPVISAPDDYQPWVGVPVVKLESDKMFRRWLVNGPFLRGTQDEHIASLGGWKKLRPEPGDAVEVDGERLEFRLYLPAGADDQNGPSIYARNCSRYWTSSTGGGYYPGIRLVRKWKERLGRRPGVHVVLYTVLDNDRARVIQALPNWRSRSEGARMWLAGREVHDGQLVRLEKGLYPVVVDVPVMGGYSAQAPKLREYTPRMHAADVARARRARTAYAGNDEQTNEMLRNYHVLRRSVQRYLRRTVADDGWGGWETHETVLPLLLAIRTAMGEDLAAETGLEQLMPIAARLKGHLHTRAADTMVSQGVFLMSPRDRQVAAWYLRGHGRALRRPMDAIIALRTHPLDVEAVHPTERYPLAGFHRSAGLLAMAGGWSGDGSRFVSVEAGSDAPGESIYTAGHLRIRAEGRTWALTRWDARHPHRGYRHLNTISVRNLLPVGPAEVTHLRAARDGSGSMTLRLRSLREIIGWDNHGRAKLPKKDPNVVIQRSVLVDYGQDDPNAMTMIVVDRVSGSGRREKSWRMDLGRVYTDTAYNRRRPTLEVGKRSLRVTPKDANAAMDIRFLSPEDVELRLRGPSGKNERGTIVEAKLDRHISAEERLEKNRLGEGVDDLMRETESVGVSDPHGGGKSRRPRLQDGPSLDGPSTSTATDDLLGEMEDALDRERRQREKKLPPVYFVAVITIQPGDGPKVSMTGSGDRRTIVVNGRRYLYSDGRLHRSDSEDDRSP